MDEKTPHQDVCTVLEKEKIFPLKKVTTMYMYCISCIVISVGWLVHCDTYVKQKERKKRKKDFTIPNNVLMSDLDE